MPFYARVSFRATMNLFSKNTQIVQSTRAYRLKRFQACLDKRPYQFLTFLWVLSTLKYGLSLGPRVATKGVLVWCLQEWEILGCPPNPSTEDWDDFHCRREHHWRMEWKPDSTPHRSWKRKSKIWDLSYLQCTKSSKSFQKCLSSTLVT